MADASNTPSAKLRWARRRPCALEEDTGSSDPPASVILRAPGDWARRRCRLQSIAGRPGPLLKAGHCPMPTSLRKLPRFRAQVAALLVFTWVRSAAQAATDSSGQAQTADSTAKG